MSRESGSQSPQDTSSQEDTPSYRNQRDWTCPRDSSILTTQQSRTQPTAQIRRHAHTVQYTQNTYPSTYTKTKTNLPPTYTHIYTCQTLLLAQNGAVAGTVVALHARLAVAHGTKTHRRRIRARRTLHRRWRALGTVVTCACTNTQQMKTERRGIKYNRAEVTNMHREYR